jgi:hypothetical protein
MSDLRTRIAAAIYEASDEYTRKLMVNPRLPGCADVQGDRKPVTYVLADAVIAELDLHVEHGRLKVIRYVSDWEINDDT